MNTESCDMVRRANSDEALDEEPGSFCIETNKEGQRQMWMVLPGGLASVIKLRPVTDGSERPSWEWDGNEEKPTLSPSVHAVECWHGWIKNGRMESC